MESFNRDDIQEFLYLVIEKSKKGKLSSFVKTRISYDVVDPLYYHNIEKASSNFIRIIYNIRKDKDGVLFLLPEGVL